MLDSIIRLFNLFLVFTITTSCMTARENQSDSGVKLSQGTDVSLEETAIDNDSSLSDQWSSLDEETQNQIIEAQESAVAEARELDFAEMETFLTNWAPIFAVEKFHASTKLQMEQAGQLTEFMEAEQKYFAILAVIEEEPNPERQAALQSAYQSTFGNSNHWAHNQLQGPGEFLNVKIGSAYIVFFGLLAFNGKSQKRYRIAAAILAVLTAREMI